MIFVQTSICIVRVMFCFDHISSLSWVEFRVATFFLKHFPFFFFLGRLFPHYIFHFPQNWHSKFNLFMAFYNIKIYFLRHGHYIPISLPLFLVRRSERPLKSGLMEILPYTLIQCQKLQQWYYAKLNHTWEPFYSHFLINYYIHELNISHK